MNDILKKHFLDPKNIGEIEGPNYSSITRSKTCNDIIKMTANIIDGAVEDIRIKVFGCGYSIAGASFVTDVLKGEKMEDIAGLIDSELKSLLADVPKQHHSCINLSRIAFEKIYNDYSQEV